MAPQEDGQSSWHEPIPPLLPEWLYRALERLGYQSSPAIMTKRATRLLAKIAAAEGEARTLENSAFDSAVHTLIEMQNGRASFEDGTEADQLEGRAQAARERIKQLKAQYAELKRRLDYMS